jgi:glutathione S-transferase
MSLTLHFHPLASYCHKVLIALYENDTPFTPNLVDHGNEAERAALLKLWRIGKFPVLPFGDTYRNVAAYFNRLKARPSYARVLREAEPYFAMFPREAPKP